MQTIRTDIKRAIFSWGFVAGIAAMFIAIIIGAWDSISLLWLPDIGGLMQGFHEQTLIQALQSDVLLMLVPIVCTLPYTTALVDDIKSGYTKAYLHKTSYRKYIMGKTISAGLSGGLVMIISVIFSYIIFALVFTPLEIVDEHMPPMLMEVLQKACAFFLSGWFWAVLGATFAVFTLSKYMAYASPFIIYYVLVILNTRYFKDFYIINPQSWLTEPYMWPGEAWGVALFLLELIAALTLVYYIVSKRKLKTI